MVEILRIIFYYPFLNLLTLIIWAVPGHYAAIGIILLTLIVRLILILPSKRAAQAQRKLAQLQPLIDELKNEYPEDKQGLAVAQMELYKKNNINPFASCGLALIQLPILYILYFTIRFGLDPNSPHLYAWVPRPDHINEFLFNINLLSPDHTYVLPVLAAILQFVQMRMTMPSSKGKSQDPAQNIQKQIMYIFPVFTLLIAQRFPAGVALYWVVTTLFSISQQYFVNKEKLRLEGVDKVVKDVERAHPGDNKELEDVAAHLEGVEPKGIVAAAETSTKKGVSVTVRKKKKS